MNKFKAGDIVTRIKDNFGNAVVGRKYIVVSQDNGDLQIRDNTPDSVKHGFNYSLKAFELANQWKGQKRGVSI